MYFTDFFCILIQLKAFGDENEIPVWGVEVFGEQVIILNQLLSSSPCIWLFLSLNCLYTLQISNVFILCAAETLSPPGLS